jgi:hypothetical protein
MAVANSRDQICLNPDCPDYREINTGNIIKKGFDARATRCSNARPVVYDFLRPKARFIFYNRHLKEEQIILICKLLVERNGIRAIERIMDIHRDTVSDIVEYLARHAREVTNFLIKDVGLTEVQVDEIWSFVKKQKNVDEGDGDADGDCCIYIAKRQIPNFICW